MTLYVIINCNTTYQYYIKGMMKFILSENSKKVFNTARRLAVLNPFGEEMEHEESKLLQKVPGKEFKSIISKIMRDANDAIEQIRKNGQLNIQMYGNVEERNLLKFAIQCREFSACYHALMKLVQEEETLGGKPCTVEIGREPVQRMEDTGFNHDEAVKTFSVFYQLCRAFYYINKKIGGSCNAMKKLRMCLWNNVFTHDLEFYYNKLCGKMDRFSTFLLGPTGTGKSTAAEAIGKSGFILFNHSTCKFDFSQERLFMTIVLSQMPEKLIESILFGHKKGSFTGATEDRKGVLEISTDYSSVFLDEIAETSPEIQVKLLNVLQSREFYPTGADKPVKFKGRVIAASNVSLEKLMTDGRFRQDLYYRLCSDIIQIPSLQERISENQDELREIMALILKELLQEQYDEKTLNDIHSQVVKSIGLNYSWPGNVRELEQCVRNIIIRKNCNRNFNTAEIIKTGTAASSENIFPPDILDISNQMETMTIDAESILKKYAKWIFSQKHTYAAVGDTLRIDQRTAKKYLTE